MENTESTSVVADITSSAQGHLAEVLPAVGLLGAGVLAIYAGIFVYKLAKRFL